MPSVSEIESVHGRHRRWPARPSAGSVSRSSATEATSSSRRSRLDRVLEHEAGDLTAIVEAGIRLRDLDERLDAHGQMLALDPPGNPTIGACLAANLSGPRRHRYGTARDLVIGVTVVLADGTIASSGGKVVKNVAGYDLAKLFCGSEGRLGLIARVALRLHPRPEASRTLVVPVASAADAGAKAQAILRAPLAASAVDLIWPGRLAVLFEGGRRGVDEQFELAAGVVGGVEDDGSVWSEIAARQASSARAPAVPSGRAGRDARGPRRGGRPRRRRGRLRPGAGGRPARAGGGGARRACTHPARPGRGAAS